MKKHSNIDQGTAAWHQIRKGKITGTLLKDLIGTPKKRQDAVYEFIADRLTVGVQEEGEYENPMERGHRLEPQARAMFELQTGKKVEEVGFCEDEENGAICNSPDGLIGEEEAVEIKCMGGKNHVKLWLLNAVPEEYFWQVVQYFVVNPKLQKLHFVGYNPDIPVHPMHIVEVTRESVSDSIEQARQVEEAFLDEVNGILKGIITL